ncbi:carbon monoxide dehydrogenase subunit G [Saccharothrix tamanrassetensis]|uniref:Carbon monoxide dehydrogenase subunit G n=1 Tax=Saccharothrix tamanrassetensis TaxID=1051531 RepID=A0A841CKP5_9PSEU|nr:SRPBCC family protein [Saccharothrix tamanrassetensis]MBB5956186.1 carbon monoxide dehydrogenase subunit G [Saccharothrix tamanrassetensis]
MTRLELRVDVAAPAETTWAAVTDWARQGEWMLFTEVRVTGGQGLGTELSAFTGLGLIGFTDTMRVTAWEPPHRCAVLHTGRFVRGTAEFRVVPHGERSEFIWSEDIPKVLGLAFAPGVRWSLRRFAEFAREYHR